MRSCQLIRSNPQLRVPGRRITTPEPYLHQVLGLRTEVSEDVKVVGVVEVVTQPIQLTQLIELRLLVLLSLVGLCFYPSMYS